MTLLATGLGLFALGLLVHALLWQIRLPRRHTRALFAIFLAAFLVAELWLAPRWSWPAQLHFVLLYFSLVMAYVITYSAIEADSPSLLMVKAIAAAGEAGLAEASFHALLTDETLIQPRVDDLVRDGMVSCVGGRYAPTEKGRRFISLFIFYRKLLGKPLGG